MEIKYIRCFASHNWRKLSTDILGNLLASFIILAIKKEDKILCESRIIIADPVSKLTTTEQNKYYVSHFNGITNLLHKFNDLMPSENNSIDIFNFNLNSDFLYFKEWLKKRDKFLNLELEKMS